MKMTTQEVAAEIEKCRKDPHYFVTKYMTVNGEPFVSNVPKEHFNEIVRTYGEGGQVVFQSNRRRSFTIVEKQP